MFDHDDVLRRLLDQERINASQARDIAEAKQQNAAQARDIASLKQQMAIDGSLLAITIQLQCLTNVVRAQSKEIACSEKRIIMAVGAETQKVIDAFNVTTTALGDRIAAIIAAENDLTPEGVAAFQVVIDQLNGMGTNPNNPVPVLPSFSALKKK